MLTYADIFSGCGGLSYGFHKNKAFQGLLAADNWPAAMKVFSENYPNVPFNLSDLHDPKAIGIFSKKLKGMCDILLGGPPCQGFSTLGKRRDGDKRSDLVDQFLALCLNISPKVIVMENVRGIVSKRHKSGITYPDHIKKVLTQRKNKYDTDNLLINALDYGLAQNRIRWIFIAVRSDINEKGVILQQITRTIKKKKTRKKLTLKDVIGDLPHIEHGEGADVMLTTLKGRDKPIYNHKAMNHSSALIERFSHVPAGGGLLDVPRHLLTNHLRKVLEKEYGDGGLIKNIYGRLDWDKPSGTIVAGIDKITCGRFVHPSANRLLTPRECARLQSFPDSFKFSGSLVNQYYMIGNAVPPKISSVIAKAIAESFRSAS